MMLHVDPMQHVVFDVKTMLIDVASQSTWCYSLELLVAILVIRYLELDIPCFSTE